MGCTAPQTNCPMAMARLMVAMPSPVEVFSGDRNSPCDCREPMVTMSSAAASRTMNQYESVSLLRDMSVLLWQSRFQARQCLLKLGMQVCHKVTAKMLLQRDLRLAPLLARGRTQASSICA